MYQPSVNQIANLYQGNPQALQQRVAQEPKGPTGLPMDLSKLMALNINLTEADAAKRQAAMAGLQQMQQQSQTGEPPTVAQQVEQAAMQKVVQMQQGQMQPQMQPPPQGLQALAQGMAGAPQQAGIDELGSNLGQHYAGGGIVAFKEGDEVEDPDVKKKLQQYTLQQQGADYVARKQAAREAKAREEAENPNKESLPQFLQDIAKFPQMFDDWKQRAREQDAVNSAQDRRMAQYKQDKLDAQQKTSLVNYLVGSPEREKEGLEKLAELSNAPLSKTSFGDLPPPKTNSIEVDMGREGRRTSPVAEGIGTNVSPNLIPASARPQPAPAAPRPQISNVNASAVPAAPAAPAAPAEKSLYEKFLEQSLTKTPEARREEALARYKKQIGDPDTSAQEKYIQQLEASRSRFAESEDPVERARAYFRDLANAGGRNWFDTGARASATGEARRQTNAQKDIEALKELMAESSKVADIKRGYKKEVFSFGEKEYDNAFKNGMDAAKEMGLEGRQRQLFAHQSAENALQRANAMKVAGMKGSEERLFDRIAADWLKKDENKGKTLSDAYAAFRLSGSPSAGMKGIMTRDQAEDNFRKDMENYQLASEMKKEAAKYYGKDPSYSEMKEYHIQKQMTGSGKGGAPTPTTNRSVVPFSSLPK